MKFGDVLKIALHNLWNNKSRTVLTVLIVAIVSSLIMALCLLGIAFIQNQVDVSKIVFEELGTTYEANYRYEYSGSDSYKMKPYSQAEIEWIDSSVEEYNHIVDTVTYHIESNSRGEGSANIYWQFMIAKGSVGALENKTYQEVSSALYQNGTYFSMYDARFANLGMYNVAKDGVMNEGRIWSASDNDKANIWIGSDYVRNLQNNGVSVKIGDTVTICAYQGGNANSNTVMTSDKIRVQEYVICGIYDSEQLKTDVWSSAPQVLLGGHFFMQKFQDAYTVSSVNMTYRPPQTEYDYNAVYDDMKAFVDRVNENVETYVGYDGSAETSFDCSYVEEMRMTVLMGTLIMGVVAILALLILLLSVGSVANTIIISVDKNRKFIGLMKAMGLNQRGVKKIVTCESLIQIILGILIGVAVLFLLQPIVLSLMESMFASMFGYYDVEFTIAVSIPVYLPIITAVLFFLFASLFSRGSLGKIARQDVISTISEVA